MLYILTRLLMTAALRLYYRRVFVTGVEMIPAKGPVILLANHHASMMDAAWLGILLKRPIHYFTRGDLFSNPVAAAILNALHMIPVFDHAGKNSIRDNESSFNRAREILLSGGIIVFFPEGSSHIDRTLKALKKGAFRLAFDSYEFSGFMQQIQLVPIGINYANVLSAGGDMMIHFSSPLLITDYNNTYKSNPAAAILHLKKEVEAGLLENMLMIQETQRLSLADRCLQMDTNDDAFVISHWMQASRRRLERQKKICEVINAMDPETAAAAEQLSMEYFNQLQQLKISDAELSDLYIETSKRMWVWKTLLPLYILGWLLNALPILVAERITEKKVSRPDFRSWIFVTSSIVLYSCWILILFAGFANVGTRYAVAVIIVTMVLGPFTAYYQGLLNEYRRRENYQKIKKENLSLVHALKAKRNIIKQICMRFEN